MNKSPYHSEDETEYDFYKCHACVLSKNKYISQPTPEKRPELAKWKKR